MTSQRLRQTLRRVIEWWAVMGGLLLIIVVLITMVNVAGFSANAVARLFGSTVPGLPGYEDAVTLMIGVAGLCMFPYCQLTGGHAAVDVLMRMAPEPVQRGMHVGSTLLVAAIALALAVMMIYGLEEARSDRTVTAVLDWPVWVFMIPGAISCALWSVASILSIRAETSE